METLSKKEILTFVDYSNRKRLVPNILKNTRITKPKLVQQVRRFWTPCVKGEFLTLFPCCLIPPFSFHLVTRRWDFQYSRLTERLPSHFQVTEIDT